MPTSFLERKIQIRPIYALYALLCLLFLYFTTCSVHNNRMANLVKEKDAREWVLAQTESQVEKLRRELSFRGTDEYVARVARETYGYLREGETRYMFEGVRSPEHVAPSIPVAFAPMVPPQAIDTEDYSGGE